MEEIRFDTVQIHEKRIKLSEQNINIHSLSLLDFLLNGYKTGTILEIFYELEQKKLIKLVDQEYEVETILSVSFENNKKKYLVKWKNWSYDFSSWEEVENLGNCREQIEIYEQESKLLNTKLLPTPSYRDSAENVIRSILNIVEECYLTKQIVEQYQKDFKVRRRLEDNKISLEHFVKSMNKHQRRKNKTLKQILLEWEEAINRKYPLFSVTVENNQDKEGPPLDFQLITDYVSSTIMLPDEPPFGCQCDGNCYREYAHCADHHSNENPRPYTTTGLLNTPDGLAIYECNKACTCDKFCSFRVVQRGMRQDLTIFRTTNRGWGLRTNKVIRRNTFIIEYLGEIISMEEAEVRGKIYDAQIQTFLYDLDYIQEPQYTIDAYKMGNLSHFINHSCDPNMTGRCVFINNLELSMPRIAFFAKRDIKAREELTFDYQMTGAIDEPKEEGSASDSIAPNSEAGSTSTFSMQTSIANINKDESTDAGSTSLQRVKCLCGAKNCRKFMY